MTMDALLQAYYEGLGKRSNWERTIADDFTFVGGKPGSVTNGKPAYVEAIRRFARVFETVAVKHAIVNQDEACVIATYDVVSPSGKTTTVDIAEVWTRRGDRLASLAIYYDTAGWQAFMAA